MNKQSEKERVDKYLNFYKRVSPPLYSLFFVSGFILIFMPDIIKNETLSLIINIVAFLSMFFIFVISLKSFQISKSMQKFISDD